MPKKTAARKQSGRDRAYLFLRNTVIADPAMAGAFLNEQELADSIGVSRTPVREALLMLSTENLIRLVPNRGAQVVQPSIRDMGQVMQARAMIECWAARSISGDCAALADTMSRRLAAQANLSEAADLGTFLDADRAFHLEMIRACGNPVIEQMYDLLQARQHALGVRSMRQNPKRRAEVLAEHQRIIDAVASADGNAIEAAILAHLDATYHWDSRPL